jgi:Holliday junction resolvase
LSSYNKAKGSKFETDVMKYLRKLGHFAERLAKAGSNDEGDLVVIIAGQTYILECKNRKKLDLPAFWDEAQTEARNYAKARGIVAVPPAFVIVKRRNKGIEDAWVIQPLEKWIEQMPLPQGDITSSEGFTTAPAEPPLPEEPTEVEQKEEEREDDLQ